MTDQNGQLSDRELEILRLLATGASNKEIAKELVISVNTVKVHLRNIFSKLEVSSRTEATFVAVQEGLVPSPTAIKPGESTADGAAQTAPGDEKANLKWSRLILLFTLTSLVILAIVLIGVVSFNWWQQQNAVDDSVTAETIEQKRWEERAEMLIPRSNFATATVNDVIYIFGGETEKGLTARVDLYQVESNSWEHVSDMPQARADIQAVTIGGQIFVPGGRLDNGELSRQLLVYETEENAWQEGAPLPVALSAYALTAFEGKLYLFGGWDGEEYSQSAFRYDPSDDEWEALTPMPTARGFAGAAISGDKIFVVGGIKDDKALNVNEEYTPGKEDGEESPWTARAPLPEERYRFGMTSIAGIVHVLGGSDAKKQNANSYKFVTQEDRWQSFWSPFDSTWRDFGIAIVGEKIFVFGGHINSETSAMHFSYQAVYSIVIPVLP